jgi:CheY-like chemotaxis protein
MDDMVKLVDAVSTLLGAIILPLVVLAIFRIFRIEINAFLHRASRLAVKGGGLDVSIDAQQAQAAGAIAAAVAKPTTEPHDPHVVAADASSAASMVASTVTPRVMRKAAGSTILWVDDAPDNNIYERRSLEAIGVSFVLAKSTNEAISKLKSQAFDVVISDMSRGIDRTAGLDLLKKARAAGFETPYVIYAGQINPERRAEAQRLGALDATSRPEDLFRIVVGALNAVT